MTEDGSSFTNTQLFKVVFKEMFNFLFFFLWYVAMFHSVETTGTPINWHPFQDSFQFSWIATFTFYTVYGCKPQPMRLNRPSCLHLAETQYFFCMTFIQMQLHCVSFFPVGISCWITSLNRKKMFPNALMNRFARVQILEHVHSYDLPHLQLMTNEYLDYF